MARFAVALGVLALCVAAASVDATKHKMFVKKDGEGAKVMEQLERLNDLKEAGFVGADEYKTRRASLINEFVYGKTSGEGDARVKRSSRVNTALIDPPNRTATNGTFPKEVQFLLDMMVDGMPRSYNDVLPTGEMYWKTPLYTDVGALDPYGNRLKLDSQIAIQERTLSREGLNMYDAATWQIALALEGLGEIGKIYEENILYVSSTGSNPRNKGGPGGIIDIRADKVDYEYGTEGITGDALEEVTLPGNVTRQPAVDGNPTGSPVKTISGAYFYRMIGPHYVMRDPLTGYYANSWKYPWPNNDTTTPWNTFGQIHWNDWKPITGENVWGCIIGPIQSRWIMNGTFREFKTFDDAPSEIQFALSILPAMKALQSPLGSLYHGPKGMKMFPADPDEKTNVSNENNFSAYAALIMLKEILVNKTFGTTDPKLIQATKDVTKLADGLHKWFTSGKYMLGKIEGYTVVYQGGHVKFDGTFLPALLNNTGGYAIDCQTWGMAVMGQALFDGAYGMGAGYNLWQAAKQLGGYYTSEGELGGVGYTTNPKANATQNHAIWSAEWSFGAMVMVKRLSWEYAQIGKQQWADDLKKDYDLMEKNLMRDMNRCGVKWCGGGMRQEDGSYLYANERFFIPWGWYANPVGSICSTAWGIMQWHDFNPFVLGGGNVSPLAV